MASGLQPIWTDMTENCVETDLNVDHTTHVASEMRHNTLDKNNSVYVFSAKSAYSVYYVNRTECFTYL